MRLGNPMPRRRAVRRTAVIAVATIAFLAGGLYLYLYPDVTSRYPFSCAIPSPTFSSDSAGASYPAPSESGGDDTISPAGACQEIAEITGQGDTLLSILNAHLDDAESARQVAASLVSVIQPVMEEPFNGHSILKPGRRYSVTIDKDGKLLEATLELDPSNVFHAAIQDNALRAWKEEVVLDFKTESVSIPIRGMLTESVLNAGESMELALKLTSTFRWDIDFQSESLRGDVLKVLVERRYADDRPAGYGRILCAVYEGRKTGKKTAVLFNNIYYDEKGVELKKNFLRSPLSVIRVTSKYGMRFHPIWKVWKHHEGVDYGAADGTPVWTVAGGVVTFAGWHGGLGRLVCVKHENGYESWYGHMRRFFVKKGQRVKQRQRIGEVGRTGDATGPHLHFQLFAGRRPMNPQAVTMVANPRTVPGPLKNRFSTISQQRLLSLEGIVVGRRSVENQTVRVY